MKMSKQVALCVAKYLREFSAPPLQGQDLVEYQQFLQDRLQKASSIEQLRVECMYKHAQLNIAIVLRVLPVLRLGSETGVQAVEIIRQWSPKDKEE